VLLLALKPGSTLYVNVSVFVLCELLVSEPLGDGKIAEHWDPMLRTDTPIDPNDKRLDH